MLIYSVTLGDNGTLWIKAINEVNKGDIQVKLRFSSSLSYEISRDKGFSVKFNVCFTLDLGKYRHEFNNRTWQSAC